MDPIVFADKRSKGLNYTCKETWSKGHKWKAPRRIQILEILDEDLVETPINPKDSAEVEDGMKI
jgi:hypothetical protein